MPAPSNPFTLVYYELWNMLLQHPAIDRDVKKGNRLRFDNAGNRDPLKSQISTSDLPELCITVENLTANIHNTSSTSLISRRYNVLVSTGDYRYTEILAQMEWAIFCALSDWQTKLSALQWKGREFVKVLRMSNGSAGLSDALRNRNIVGWSSAWQCEVEMHFVTVDLQAETLSEK